MESNSIEKSFWGTDAKFSGWFFKSQNTILNFRPGKVISESRILNLNKYKPTTKTFIDDKTK
jgi:hypothetical protein